MYLFQRGNIYYYRWQIPADLHLVLGAREYVRSLKTSNRFTAFERAAALNEMVQIIKEVRLTQGDKQEQSYQSFIRNLYSHLLIISEKKPSTYEELQLVRSMYSTVRKWFDEGVLSKEGKFHLNSCSIYELIEQHLDSYLPTLVRSEAWQQDLVIGNPEEYKRFLDDYIKIFRVFIDKTLKNLSPEKGELELPDFLAMETRQPYSKEVDSKAEKSSLLLSEVFSNFLQYKCEHGGHGGEGISEKVKNEYRGMMKRFLAVNEDEPIGDYTRKKVRNALLVYGGLPKKNKLPYKNIEDDKEFLNIEIPEEDLIAPKTVGQMRRLLQGIFKYACNELELIESSPVTKLELDESPNQRTNFSESDMKVLLTAALKVHKEWQKWVVLLAAYTGARRGEIMRLEKRDVKYDVESSRYYLHIREGKTENARRQIPLHAELVSNGFLNFVTSRPDGLLFDGVSPNGVSQWFSGFMDKLAIDSITDLGKIKVFHSFRHTVITRSLAKGNPRDHVQQVTGHEKVSAGSQDAYRHDFELKYLLPVIDCLNYRL